MLCNVEMPSIFSSVVVAVSDERCLPVIVNICVGNGHPFRGVGDIDESVVVILAMSQIGVELACCTLMIDLAWF